MADNYCTLQDVKDRLELTTTDATRDSNISLILADVSRWIENECGRFFYPSTETRYYTAVNTGVVNVDDLLSVTTLKTDGDGDRTYETTWSSTDYDLMPYNHTPKRWIEIAPKGLYTFPLTRKGVQIIGSFGFATNVPGPIREACILKTVQLYKRRASGQTTSTGNQAMGSNRTPTDSEIAAVLAPYRRRD